ncbi:chain-length determining protein [Prevotella sp.]|uniref:chain-length determining protein n=1 Tax=uncultured Prevotella sp. TaxID=159272 RepID=UPI0025DC364A|nr:chain-length determining protein [uncultured Prevotella sp.]
MENNNNEVIDLRVVFKKIMDNKMLYFKVMPIVFVLSCAYILCIPRTYTSSLSLAPEVNNGSGLSGSIGSIASSFGFDLSSMETSDAINPMLYPDLMEDNGFVVGLFDIKVVSANGEIKCNYYNYLAKHQDVPFWSKGFKSIKKLFAEKESLIKGDFKNNPYRLSKKQNDIAEIIRKEINISIDKKTAVITITAKAQDPLICKTLADSVKERLQVFITNYRTRKSRVDEEYYKNLVVEAKHEYEKARQLYGSYADANTDLQLISFRSKQEDLENDMQLKYNAYSTMMTQYQAAKAKVQERTPAFTIVKGAAVPVKASSPKRMIFVLSMLFLTFITTTLYIAKEELKDLFKI